MASSWFCESEMRSTMIWSFDFEISAQDCSFSLPRQTSEFEAEETGQPGVPRSPDKMQTLKYGWLPSFCAL